jgi:type VI secretion system secreted protein VgrG
MADQPILAYLSVAGRRIEAKRYAGREAMSETFALTVEARLPEGDDVDPDAVVKSEASLEFVRDGIIQRRIDGLVQEVAVRQSIRGRPDLRLVLVPKFALSRLRTNIKIYRNKSVPDIVSEVLDETGVRFELRLSGAYPVRPYTVQHRESDFHFVSRMLEEEGIFYFFGEGDVMVIGDNVAAYDEAGAVPFRQTAGMDEHDASVWSFGELAEAGVSNVSLRDWSIDKPSLPLDVNAAGPTDSGPEWYDYPGEYEEPGDGQRIANLIAESYACAADGVAGTASAPGFGPGRTFSLSETPGGIFDDRYVLTVVEHDYDRMRTGWAVDFEGLEAATVLRPMREHHEPILSGPVTGFVTGPPGADIHCDELGRIKVHFHWDRLQPKDDDCSHWVPVIQDNTGHSVQIPRIGWEVLVHFLEGDPDRPVALGRVYNGGDTFPIELPAKKTYTALGSLSSPTRDGNNEIQIEDMAGRQRIKVKAEKDQNIVIANDRSEHVMSNEMRTIQRDESITIGNDQTIDISANLLPQVKANQTVAIGGNNDQTVGGSDGIAVTGNHSLTVGGVHKRRIATRDSATAKNITESVGAAILEASLKDNSLSASKGMVVAIGGAMIEVAKAMKNEAATYARTETVGGVIFSKAKGEHKVAVGDKRITTVGGLMKVDAAKELSLNGAELLSLESLSQKHEASTSVTFAIGNTTLTMKEGVIHILTPKIALNVTGTNNLGAEESYQN